MINPPEWRIGRHVFRQEAGDLLCVRLEGSNSLEESIQMVHVYRTLGEQQPYFVLADLETAEKMDSEARRFMSENMQAEWFLGFIFYNTRLVHRALARGLIIAAELFHAVPQSRISQRLHFVSTQDQAHALLAQLRVADTDVSLQQPSA